MRIVLAALLAIHGSIHVLGGIEIPVRGSVIWKLPAGDFEYYRWEILDVETNRPELW